MHLSLPFVIWTWPWDSYEPSHRPDYPARQEFDFALGPRQLIHGLPKSLPGLARVPIQFGYKPMQMAQGQPKGIARWLGLHHFV
ncbi:hypothetical protein AVEN_209390-1 [Araneus ventricosus]|uniref:Uncharacterized protein n=1 Tax=Araneus ventricosus TaxID=182803 RepID=A0A4Y2FGB9_ARAVE|nr:hypothetical protein AVEN_209390-1 [Araneus ventricosus]